MAYEFINQTGIVQSVITGLGVNVTGSDYLSYFAIMLLLIAIMLMFRVPMIFVMLFMTPLVIVLMAFVPDFYGVGAVFLFGLGLTLAYNWFFKPS